MLSGRFGKSQTLQSLRKRKILFTQCILSHPVSDDESPDWTLNLFPAALYRGDCIAGKCLSQMLLGIYWGKN